MERAVSRRPEKELEIQHRVLSSPVQSGAIMREAFFRTVADLRISLFHCSILGNS